MPGSISLPPDVRALTSEAVAVRRGIHRCPEVGFRERRTCRLILDLLRKHGVPARRMAGTGVVGLVRGARPGKTLLVRVSIDALTLREESRVPYRSRIPGIMHA